MTLTVSLRKYEKELGIIYLLIQQFLLPQAIGMLSLWLDYPVWLLNFLYFCMNFLAVCVIFHRFLIDSFQILLEYPWRVLRCAGQGLLMYFVGAFLISMLILSIKPDFANINDQNILEMVAESKGLLFFATMLLVPVAEETLFRGLLFGWLFPKNKVLAYAVSVITFSVVHMLTYVFTEDPLTILLCLLQYLPAGFAMCFAYHKSDTIWTPIMMHIVINFIGLSQ